MTEVFFLVLALVVSTPQGPDGAVRAVQAPTLAACQSQADKINAEKTEKGTGARATCVTLTFPSELFKKGVEV